MVRQDYIRQADRHALSYRVGQALAAALLGRRWLALAATLILFAALASGLGRLTVSGDYRAFFDTDNPELVTYDALAARYGKLDSLVITLRVDDGDLFTPQRLASLRAFTDRLWSLPHASRVDSIANHQHSWAEQDELFVADLVPEDAELDPAEAARLRAIALDEPMLVDFLVSSDGATANVIVTLQPPAQDEMALSDSVRAARRMIATFAADAPDFQVALVGDAALDATLREVSEHDARLLSPIMMLLVIAGLWIFFGTAAPAMAAAVIVVLSVTATVGLMGHLAIPMMSATAAVPVMVLTIAVADAIHVVTTMRGALPRLGRHDAIVESLAVNFEPVVITGLTTAAGFLSLNFSDAPPYRDVGNMAAAGAMLAMLFTVFLLPILLSLFPAPRPPRPAVDSLMERIPQYIARHPGPIAVIFIACTAIGLCALPRLQINDKFVDYFSPGVTFREDAEFTTRHLPGLYFLEFSVTADGEGGVNEPAYLQRVEDFAQWLRAQPGVTHVAALPDIMKRLNRNMHGDDPEYYRLPASRQEAAQYLLLYEMSLPFGRELSNRIDIAKSASRVTVVMNDISTAAMQDLEARAEAWLQQAQMPADGTGLAILFAHLTERTLNSMAWGTGLAMILIALCLFAALRSVSLAALSLLVNCAPIIVVFGGWAVLVGEIGLYAAAVAAVALGQIVDFAVHFLVKYRRARQDGADAATAVTYVYRLVGPALLTSAVVLILGFGTLLFADFAINAKLGLLTALVIATAFIIDMLVLPALLILFDRKKETAPHVLSHAE